MKWISERDALIAQTMAFVQSVTGKKGDFHPPERPTAAPDVPVGSVTVETVAVETLAVEINPPPVPLAPAVMIPPARTGGDFRSEMQARIANFRKHQERFEREREEYCAATLTRLRAAIRDPSLRPPAEN
ncbi:hypothetical protein AB7Z32_16945 [Bradyrhizobium sp. 482_C4_N1_1]|uniref:Uncharacterized protein n=1 Tax=Bradyrhizobium barranii subsp. barranii TaxID=2823807 RepID=A0A939MH07_9BRAD|nr:hypothetical protein [Bradyrhizobium barranii]UEM09523.1 hypothetical protein J4G43_033070 [Bradyrhizobium barranii subsp. barranii]